jgi:hypothetical protein
MIASENLATWERARKGDYRIQTLLTIWVANVAGPSSVEADWHAHFADRGQQRYRSIY